MKSYRLEGLDCANCAMKIEKGVQKINGVKEATVNFTSGKLTIDAEEDHLATIEQEIKKSSEGIRTRCQSNRNR
ncbi:cation transporter [Enterococcus faecium]|nr:cation transporter [Enterococcus faecium]MCC9083005.1 cation transporter [Enterococcus faecium]